MDIITRTLLDNSTTSSSSSSTNGNYTVPVVGIFVIMILGLCGSLIPPLVALYLPKFDLNSRYGFRFFNGLAAGIVLGVGYIHSIPDSIESFDDALKDKSGTAATYAWGGLLAMIGSLLTFMCEEFVHRRIGRFAALHGHDHGHDGHDHGHNHGHEHGHDHGHHGHDNKSRNQHQQQQQQLQQVPPRTQPKSPINSVSVASNLEEASSTSSDDSGCDSPSPINTCIGPSADTCSSVPCPASSSGSMPPEVSTEASNPKDLDVVISTAYAEEKREEKGLKHISEEQLGYYTELYVLLFGLTFHSLFVGIALGVAGNDWGLFAAILFHQFFEGLALGARVARAGFKKKIHIWLLDIVYALAIPVGIAIGIGIQSAIVDQPFTYSIVTGIFQGLSAGVLIYVALIHMMKEEMARPEFRQGGALLYIMYAGFLIGAGCMAVIGIWA